MSILEKIGIGIGRAQGKNPKMFLLMLVVVLVVSLPGIPMLIDNVEPSLEKILPQEVSEVKTMNDMRSQFGADMMYLLVYTEGPAQDIANPDVMKYIDTLSQRLRGNEFILQVRNPADFVKMNNNFVIPNTDRDVLRLLEQNPMAKDFYNDDRTLAVIEIRSDTGADSDTINEVVNGIEREVNALAPMNPGVTHKITGFNAIDRATFNVIIQDFQFITGFSFLFMLLFLMFYFKSAKKVIGSVAVIMISVLVTLGITGYIGLTITVVTMVAAAMIMALGISYGINVTVEYYLERKNYNKKESLIRLNSNMVRALIGSSLTTSAGFLALLFGIIPAMKNLGVVLAIGISTTLLVSVLFLPVILIYTEKKNNKEAIRSKHLGLKKNLEVIKK